MKISKIKDRVIVRLKEKEIKKMGGSMPYIQVPLAILENMLSPNEKYSIYICKAPKEGEMDEFDENNGEKK